MAISQKQFFVSAVVPLAVVLFVSAFIAGAAPKDGILYPVLELGGCKDEQACRAFCDERSSVENQKACIAFAKKHNLLPPEELREAEYYVITLGITRGPGGCKDRATCDSYCEDTAHLDECLDFAERHSLRSAEEIAEGRKVASALKQGAGLPGGCRTRAECTAYCDSPAHMRVCVEFAEKSGFISKEEADEAKKIIPLIEQGGKTPGACARKDACEAYCYDPSHIDECLAFAEKAGLLPPDELADAKKVALFIKSGQTPGGCRRRAECEQYCSDAAHFEECVAFGEQAGLMTREDAELARKVKGTGPGGCNSREKCEDFCRDPAHRNECVSFAKERGLEEFSELEEEERARVEGEVKVCIEKPNCKEMVACFQDISARTGEGEEGLSEEARAKLNSCIAEISRELRESELSGGGRDSGGESAPARHASPPDGSPGAAQESKPQGGGAEYQKEYEKQYQEEYQKQYDEEYQRQFQEEYQRRIQQPQP